MDEEEIDKTIKEYQKYAQEQGFKLNPNTDMVKAIIGKMLEKEEAFGERYCPCQRMTGKAEQDKDKICPCSTHKEDIEKEGHCHCNLFVK